ncbi:hypothetical protein EXIGLDRAFT_691062 [Exidia glandulosa HHB12029]|uniref:Uncharacterized protein n=1 Tax=Exidia glandulosa HHB12029 TaxID=1314781 RepID=A0A165PA24_EXIGL|nr:hypothetical protein EXIGLDRAFT_691062 [Exidia glandulosa HHB12029]
MDGLGGDILEDETIRAYFRDLEAARARQIAAGEDEIHRTARDVVTARARMLDADAQGSEAKSQYEEALACEARAENWLAMARRPLVDDPVVRCQMGRIHILLMRRIPPEILGLIFHATVETVHGMTSYILLTAKERVAMQQAPYRLGLVCRRWRAVALRTPAIWRLIWVDLSDVTRTTRGLYEMYVKTSFERAARRGISLRMREERLSLHLENKKHEDDRARILELADVIMRVDGVVDLNIWSLTDAMFDKAVPCKSLLKLTTCGADPEDLICQLSTLAPNLQHISLGVFRDFARTPRPHVSVRSIKFVTSYTRPMLGRPHGLETLFQVFPQAQEITLSLTAGSYPTLPHLRHDTLEVLRIDSTFEIPYLAERYDFRQLRELDLRLWRGLHLDRPAENLLVHFIKAGGGANLKRLSLRSAFELGPRFLEALSYAPLLETILCDGMPSEALLAGLANTDGEWICPRLSSLVLNNVTDTDAATWEALLNLVTQRKEAYRRGEAVAPLTEVGAWIRNSPVGYDFLKRIRAVISQ